MQAPAELSPKVYGPGKPELPPFDVELLSTFIRLEIIVGGGLLAAGGFALRATGSYNLAVFGSLLIAAGILRLWISDFPQEEKQSAYPKDRLIFRLRSELDADHFIATEYPLVSGDSIDLLVVGYGGVFSIGKLTESGRYTGEEADEKWEHIPRNSDKIETIPNPLKKQREKTKRLKEFLGERGITVGKIEFQNLIVTMKHQVEGNVFDLDEVFALGEVAHYIKEHKSRKSLDWEQINQLEKTMKERMHRVE